MNRLTGPPHVAGLFDFKATDWQAYLTHRDDLLRDQIIFECVYRHIVAVAGPRKRAMGRLSVSRMKCVFTLAQPSEDIQRAPGVARPYRPPWLSFAQVTG
ncbi:hypothetical protein AL035_11230 [Salipiger aestuarii]|uniref:hypothetical protein n=1 Tax=Salipiger aestuarii TaxID=568098 RepID=UPI000DBAA837|nr:hypothetical protein [Salipiger aestuarii]KAB2541628.1 hypothetical protein AL035_11230 [Salipiger aestuarii]